MKPVYERFLKECNENENKYFSVYDHYTANFNRKVLSGKFYSKHEAVDLTKANVQLFDKIKNYLDKGSKDKYDRPITGNMDYGWYCTPLVDTDRTDERLYHPNIGSATTEHEIRIKMDPAMKIPKWSGIPWK